MKYSEYKKVSQLLNAKEISEFHEIKYKGKRFVYLDKNYIGRYNYKVILTPINDSIYCIWSVLRDINEIIHFPSIHIHTDPVFAIVID